jgi:DNA-directed RNA polymerase subunit RPC12/RpoP
MTTTRFTDKNYRLSDFENEVWVVCPSCSKQAISMLKISEKKARLVCAHCGHHAVASAMNEYEKGKTLEVKQAAHLFFDAELWFATPFKGEVFWAYNPEHLEYLEQYIAAKIREHKDRSHFTLLEKLPKFYHEAKNREGLLKVIDKLNKK